LPKAWQEIGMEACHAEEAPDKISMLLAREIAINSPLNQHFFVIAITPNGKYNYVP
jgi:hypothetical protein